MGRKLQGYARRGESIINIDAFGIIDGKHKYCYSSYILTKPDMYDAGSYENMLEILKAPDEKTVIIKLQYRKNKLTLAVNKMA